MPAPNSDPTLDASYLERVHGWWRAARALVRGLRLRKTPMRITIDGRTYRTGTPAVTVSNGPYHGLGFAISPDQLASAARDVEEETLVSRTGGAPILDYRVQLSSNGGRSWTTVAAALLRN